MALASTPVFGFGPRAVRSDEKIALAMQELWLGGTVTPAGARLAVRHVFQSAEQGPLEVVYAFALPRDAALRRFVISGADFEMASELQPTEKAREAYEQGLEEGHLSSLAQVYRDGVINLMVGNIRPGETVKVLLELVAGVESRDDGFRFRFPFTMAPCYHAEARMSLVDGQGNIELPEERFGDVLLPSWQAGGELHRVGFGMEIRHPAGLAEVSSPSHPLRIGMGQEGSARTELAVAKDLPDRDLVLDVRAKETTPCVFSGVDDAGAGRVLALIPSPAFGATANAPRRLVFVVDRSGSMDGQPMAQALQAVRACLGALSEEDAFGIVAFDDVPESFSLQPAGRDARKDADGFLQQIDARGGTELGPALLKAAEMLPDGGEVLLLTDGQVFGGEDIQALTKSKNLRLHCLGIGSASQDRFLAQLARECGGVSRFMTARERVDMAALELFSAIGNPVATEVAVSLSAEAAVVQPAPPKQVYAGTPLVVFASGSPARAAMLQVAWNQDQRLELPVAFADADLGETLKLLQGARIITDLEAQMGTTSADPAGRRTAKRQEDALLRASTEYGLASRAMSLVAVVRRKGDQAGAVPTTRVVPVGMPQDVEMRSYFVAQPDAVYGAAPGAPISMDAAACGAPPAMLARSRGASRKSAPPLLHRLVSAFREDEDKVEMYAANGPTDEDFLVDLAGRLLPDGGMPVKDAEERLPASALALLAFTEMAQSAGTTAFDSHIRRLTGYLQSQDLSILPYDRKAVLEKALHLAAKGTVPVGAIALARQHQAKLENAWKALRDLLD